MSYLVLARKYRPQTFAGVVGQKSVVRTLQNAISRNRVAHAMIFSGVRGVGKTTLARIMAKALSCTGDDGVPPCDKCPSCEEITKGTALDLHEIDGASNRGIQEIRELKEDLRFLPTNSKYKIIIIDEVHMLTTEAFNALLKTLEEPPDHVIFMFATTELHKIPVTILSRCQRYELKRIPHAELLAFFAKIADQEKVTISATALEMIAREAEGSVRDGLSLLDQIFAFGDKEMTDADVREVLGLVDSQVYESLAAVLLGGDLTASLQILDSTYGAGIDIKRFTADLLNHFRAILICKSTTAPESLLDVSDRELEVISTTAANYSIEHLSRFFDLLIKGIEEMQYSSMPRLVLEMTFIKALQTGKVVGVTEIIAKMDKLLAGVDIEDEPVAPIPQPMPPSITPVAEPITTSEPEPVPSVAPNTPSEPSAENVKKKPENYPTPLTTKEYKYGGGNIDVLGKKECGVRKKWEDFIAYVKDRKPWMAQVINLCEQVKEEDGSLVMKFDDHTDCQVLEHAENLKLFTAFAQDFYQCELKIVMLAPGLGCKNTLGEDGPQEERRALARDPLVEMTADIFNGQVVGVRTGPRSR